ncbi:GNAT family N-acetyltransferase [uncultured Massilia sp.]|uniref:GNAT family N-acetyltransferase n=1 Tax=uncultured Massilia sp. TaxID=169973 RepID=UPI0025F1AB51|nr:GNAT family N-acetyltransferase [uncultured Massilia sp.]
MKICKLDAMACAAALDQLDDLLLDAVAHGASLGFLAGVDGGEARRYWDGVRAAVADGTHVLLAAAHEGTLVGTVQLALCQKANGRHRAEVQKMIVHSRVRRRGLGSVLLRAAEAEARALNRGLLFLDTEAGSGAEQLYRDLGYTRVGEVPDYACTPGGKWHPTAIYYKTLFAPESA